MHGDGTAATRGEEPQLCIGEGPAAMPGEGTAAPHGEEPPLYMARERRLRVVRDGGYAW